MMNEPQTKTGRWLAEAIDPDDLPEGWDDPHALIAKIEAEATSSRRPVRRDPGRFIVLIALTAERLRHPRTSYRNVMARLTRHSWPSIGSMTPAEFSAYAKRSGIEEHLVKTLSKGGGTREVQNDSVGRLQSPSEGSER